MAEPQRDAFDAEMDALRTEVGRFVLRLLTDENPNNDVLDRVGKRLATHVSENARPVSALNPEDRQFLMQLSRRVESLDREVRRLRVGRGTGNEDVTGPIPEAEPDLGIGLTEEGTFEQRRFGLEELAPWVPWAISAILAAALLIVLGFMLFGQRPDTGGAQAQAASASAPVEQVDPDGRWLAVLAVVDGWPAEERLAARRILCGVDSAEAICPPWDERSAALAEDPAARSRAGEIISQALAQADCPVRPTEGATSLPTRTALDPNCLLGAAG